MFRKRWKYPTKTGGGRKAKMLPLYNSWFKMVSRCTDPANKDYRYYGGRGITVCEEWLSYDNFYEWAMANGYREDLTIDRVDVNKGYSPDNCRWETRKVQARNTTRNVYIDGKCLSQIAEEAGLSPTLVTSRYDAGYHDLESLIAPPKALLDKRRCEGKTLREIAEETGIDVNTIRGRWKRGIRDYAGLSKPLSGGKV